MNYIYIDDKQYAYDVCREHGPAVKSMHAEYSKKCLYTANKFVNKFKEDEKPDPIDLNDLIELNKKIKQNKIKKVFSKKKENLLVLVCCNPKIDMSNYKFLYKKYLGSQNKSIFILKKI